MQIYTRHWLLRSLTVILITVIGLGILRFNAGPENFAPEFISFAEADITKLPFANTKLYPLTDGEAKGTVIFIPQIHRMPGSNLEDKANDLGYKTQKEIYAFLNTLADKFGLTYFMGESGMYGELAEGFTQPVVGALQNKKSLEENWQQFVGANNSAYADHIPGVEKALENTLSAVDRNLYLRGANIVFEAERGDKVLSYGSQNEETYIETVRLVQERLAIQNQLNRWKNLNGSVELQDLLKLRSGSAREKLKLLESIRSRLSANASTRALRNLEKVAEQRGDTQAATSLQKITQQAASLENFLSQPISSVQLQQKISPVNLPSSPSALEQRQKENNRKFNEIVITRRSREAAENFVNGLESSGNKAGVLVYGAGHSQQIVERLNSLGYEVIVVSPETVKQRYPNL